MRVLDCYVLVEDGADLVFHCRSLSQRRNRRQGSEKKDALYHSLLQDCLRILSGPAWIRTRDQRIMSQGVTTKRDSARQFSTTKQDSIAGAIFAYACRLLRVVVPAVPRVCHGSRRPAA